jgi:hypothetical protein
MSVLIYIHLYTYKYACKANREEMLVDLNCFFFSTGISDTVPGIFCYKQVAILLQLLGITVIISPTLSLKHLSLSLKSNLALAYTLS